MAESTSTSAPFPTPQNQSEPICTNAPLHARQHAKNANDTLMHGVEALGLVQLEAIKAVFVRRVMQAVATIPNATATRQREAIISSHRQMGAELLAKFDVKEVEDIPSNQFAAAHQFLEGFVLAFGHKAGAQA